MLAVVATFVTVRQHTHPLDLRPPPGKASLQGPTSYSSRFLGHRNVNNGEPSAKCAGGMLALLRAARHSGSHHCAADPALWATSAAATLQAKLPTFAAKVAGTRALSAASSQVAPNTSVYLRNLSNGTGSPLCCLVLLGAAPGPGDEADRNSRAGTPQCCY